MISTFQKCSLCLSLLLISALCFAQTENLENKQNQEDIVNNFTQEIDSSPAIGEYSLSPGDIVSVIVFGEPDISDPSVRIPISGIYNYPLIGEIVLVNETTKSLAGNIEERLNAGFLSNPKVTVNIVKYRPVIVTGDITSAGIIDYQEGMTIRVLSALAQVEINNSELNRVKVQRKSKVFTPEHLDSQILPGDIVSYSKREIDISDYYYIFGEVNRSGRYEYEQGLTIEKAVIVAGGFTAFSSKGSAKIRRNEAEKVIKVKLNELIEPGDVITIKKRWF